VKLSPRLEYLLVGLLGLAILLPFLGSYTLIDPWETHYGEVARRMLEDGDWVVLRWQNEVFRSKPVLTFWLMAASLWAFGFGDGGAYPGELPFSETAAFAVRLPFVLLAVGGAVLLFWMLRHFFGRRTAWISFAVLLTTPFFTLIARQGITDMPLCATVMGALALFAMACECDDETPVRRLHATLFIGFMLLAAGTQIVGFAVYGFNHTLIIRSAFGHPALWSLIATAVPLGWLVFDLVRRRPSRRSLYMFWFYALIGISALAKGPPGIAVVGGVCFFYLLLTRRWSLLSKLEIPRGIVIAALLIVPWHLAMFLSDGFAWAQEYFGQHMFQRFGSGVHGDRGSFGYYLSQLGIGLVPWCALALPALGTALREHSVSTPIARTRLLIAIWALFGIAFFCVSQTKFHHYILPAMPAFSVLIGCYLAGHTRAPLSLAAAVTGIAILALLARDLAFEQKQLLELFIYRYDRPWPSGAPWHVDLAAPFWLFLAAFALFLGLSASRRCHRFALVGCGAVAIAFSFWQNSVYMAAAAPHWGQKQHHVTYFKRRTLHGAEIQATSVATLRDFWQTHREFTLETVLPDGLAVGQPKTITLRAVPGASITVSARINAIGDHRLTISATPTPEEEQALATFFATATANQKAATPTVLLDADRLIAWQLNWRGENFWSSGDIFGATPDAQTVFSKLDDGLRRYLEKYGRDGRRYFVITEAPRVDRVIAQTPADATLADQRIEDSSSNKYTLFSFVFRRSGPAK
jgi:4-amino-4-deoxy-L-arabinose transferase-like glycosyltransferase